MSWIKWDNLCLKRENGGLGFTRLEEFNLSLLEKWVSRLLKERESLWYKMLDAWYGEEGGRLCFDGRGGSVWWENFKKVRMGAALVNEGWLVDNINREVGNGFP